MACKVIIIGFENYGFWVLKQLPLGGIDTNHLMALWSPARKHLCQIENHKGFFPHGKEFLAFVLCCFAYVLWKSRGS